MALSVGTYLGSYEIIAPIGAGGMGEVYRARDTRLKREVALKVLSDSFASDPERMARFQREAEVLASLNHPNIAQIYGSGAARVGDGTGRGRSPPRANASSTRHSTTPSKSPRHWRRPTRRALSIAI